MATTWTIRADKVLDKLVEENVRALGYSSKAELVREAVREFILKRNAGRLGLLTLDRQREEGKTIDPNEALERLSTITKDKGLVDRILEEERDIVEKALLRCVGDATE
ncbi:MAG: ribbon-helix-helix protein, CopG family [Candidatus Heimdallarchaeota archaeon]